METGRILRLSLHHSLPFLVLAAGGMPLVPPAAFSLIPYIFTVFTAFFTGILINIPVNKTQYKQYLLSDHWKSVKKKYWPRCDGVCERCRLLPAEETHHLNYDNLFSESGDDILIVCSRCHDFIGGYSDFDPSVPYPDE